MRIYFSRISLNHCKSSANWKGIKDAQNSIFSTRCSFTKTTLLERGGKRRSQLFGRVYRYFINLSRLNESAQRAVDKWNLPFSFSLPLSLFSLAQPNHTSVPDSTPPFLSALLRSNLVEFSWADILLSSRAYLYLAYESSGPFARFANCTVAPAFSTHEKDRVSPSSPIRDGGLHFLHFGA